MDVAADETAPPADADAWDTAPHPWRRYAARVLDVQLFGGLLLSVGAFAAGWFAPDWVVGLVVQGGALVHILLFGPLSWALSAPVVALFLAKFGTTPGKLLLGIRVAPADGSAPTVARLLKRELRMLIWGAGFAIPLLSLIAMLTSFEKVNKGEPARWDEETALVVEARRAAGWQLVGIIVGTVAVLVILSWAFVERLAGSLTGL